MIAKGDDPVKTTAITFRMDDDLKKQTEETLNEIGLNMSAAFTVFAKAIVRTGTIPFKLTVDPFYRTGNQKELLRRIELYESGETRGQQVAVTIEELEAFTNA
jgi:DNA-damage-inducible protein J